VIELKTGPEIVPLLKAELERLKPAPTIDLLIISFKKETVSACRKILPDIRTHWLTAYKRDKATGIWHPTVDEVLAGLRETEASGLGTQGNREVFTEHFLKQLRDGGLTEFHVWTIDDADDARYFKQLGAIGITTNRPSFHQRSALTLSAIWQLKGMMRSWPDGIKSLKN
jgi:glycerophosphoryl diester phosphodiesterase